MINQFHMNNIIIAMIQPKVPGSVNMLLNIV